LKENFLPRKKFTQLLLELQTCTQKKSETILQYTQRYEVHVQNLLQSARNDTDNDTELVGRQATIRDVALQSYMMGVLPEFQFILRSRNPSSFDEASVFAIEEERILESNKLKLKCFDNARTNNQINVYHSNGRPFTNNNYQHQNKLIRYNNNPNNYTNSSRDNYNRFNTHSNRNNFSYRTNNNYSTNFKHQNNNDFPRNNFNNNRNNNNFKANNNNVYVSYKFCDYCQRNGHIMSECRKRKLDQNKGSDRNNQNSLNQNNYFRNNGNPRQHSNFTNNSHNVNRDNANSNLN
jgi:hypothetical protein